MIESSTTNELISELSRRSDASFCGYSLDEARSILFGHEGLKQNFIAKNKLIEEISERAERQINKLKSLVTAAYSEGWVDGMGNLSESENWENSQTKMCLEDGFEISKNGEQK